MLGQCPLDAEPRNRAYVIRILKLASEVHVVHASLAPSGGGVIVSEVGGATRKSEFARIAPGIEG
jgi:hypothetical protein